MNSKTKNIGLLAILPLLAFALTTGFVEDADAKKAKENPTNKSGPDTKHIVCGGALCSEVPDDSDASSSTQDETDKEETTKQSTQQKKQSLPDSNDAGITTTGLSFEGVDRYSVWFQIDGEKALSDGTIVVSSDTQSKEIRYRGIPSGAPSGVSLDIRADDPNSIRAEFVDVKTSVSIPNDAGITTTGLSFEGVDRYSVWFQINGDKALSNGKILVSTDLQSKEVQYRGIPSGSPAGVSLDIRADDPNSIHAVFQN